MLYEVEVLGVEEFDKLGSPIKVTSSPICSLYSSELDEVLREVKARLNYIKNKGGNLPYAGFVLRVITHTLQ